MLISISSENHIRFYSVPTYAAGATNTNTAARPNNTTLPETSAASAVNEHSLHGSPCHERILSDIPVANSNEAKLDKTPPISSVSGTASTSTTELDEIRQRRLQKFGPTTSSLSDNGND